MASDILIVDDEADIRDLVAGILEDEGFNTRTARDSDSALTEIGSRRRIWYFSTSGCRAPSSMVCNCSSRSRRTMPTFRW